MKAEPPLRQLLLPDLVPAGEETGSSLDADGTFRCLSGYRVEPSNESAGCQRAGYHVELTAMFTFAPRATTATLAFVDKLSIRRATRDCEAPRPVAMTPSLIARLVPQLGTDRPEPEPKLVATICRDARLAFAVGPEVTHRASDFIHVFSAEVERVPVKLLAAGREIARWEVGRDLHEPCRDGRKLVAPRLAMVDIVCTADVAIISAATYRDDSADCDARGQVTTPASFVSCDPTRALTRMTEPSFRRLRVNLAGGSVEELKPVEEPIVEVD